MISLVQLLEDIQKSPKALLLAGAPGAGKGTILRQIDFGDVPIFNLDDTIIALSKTQGFTLDQKNADVENRSAYMKAMYAATKDLKDNKVAPAITTGQSFVLDGTSASYNQTSKLKAELEEKGYKVDMFILI